MNCTSYLKAGFAICLFYAVSEEVIYVNGESMPRQLSKSDSAFHT